MSYLVDSNVFLEILLGQPNKERCKQFLQENSGDCGTSDYSLHSIGMITFRGRREDRYRAFLQDTFPGLALLHLDKQSYPPCCGPIRTLAWTLTTLTNSRWPRATD
jgi:hypothetical protein